MMHKKEDEMGALDIAVNLSFNEHAPRSYHDASDELAQLRDNLEAECERGNRLIHAHQLDLEAERAAHEATKRERWRR